jgi:hypothetical protein
LATLTAANRGTGLKTNCAGDAGCDRAGTNPAKSAAATVAGRRILVGTTAATTAARFDKFDAGNADRTATAATTTAMPWRSGDGAGIAAGRRSAPAERGPATDE